MSRTPGGGPLEGRESGLGGDLEARVLARIREAGRRWMPRGVLRRLRPGSLPAPGRTDFGDLRRTRPVSRHFGFERGLPVDRMYVEMFLAAHAADVRGRVLEVGDSSYTRRFGGDRVTRSDVLHVDAAAPGATIVADLADAADIPSDAFDCLLITQTLQLVYDARAAIRTMHRILAPGGTALVTVPGISQLDAGEWRSRWYWSFTEASATRLFADHFPGAVTVEVHGNVLAAVAFLEGLAAGELQADELAVRDPSYPVTIAIRAVKSGQGPVSR